MKYRYIGNRADSLESGRPVEPGDFVELSDEELEQPHNAMLLEEGQLLLIGDDKGEFLPPATDAAYKLATKENVELTEVTGTGADGQITVGDVERTIKEREETA